MTGPVGAGQPPAAVPGAAGGQAGPAGGQAPAAQAINQDLIAAITQIVQAALAPLQAALTPAVLQEAGQENLNAIYPSKIELQFKKYVFGIFIYLPSLVLGFVGTVGGIRLGIVGYRILSQVSWLAPSGLMLAGIGGILFSTVPLWILAAKKCHKIWQNLSKDLSIVSKISYINDIAKNKNKENQLRPIVNKAIKEIKTAYYNSGNWRAIAVLIATKAAQEAKKHDN
ncbi:MAG: hypothetical protein LLG04_13465 [Parachlamydia sp.]|nr:hypothetical protein [Parachlamydia sp.]